MDVKCTFTRFRALERHGCKQTWSNEAAGSSADVVATVSGVKESTANITSGKRRRQKASRLFHIPASFCQGTRLDASA